MPSPPGTVEELVRLTHGQLAALVGATRERVTTALAERGCVSLHRGKSGLQNREALAALVDGAARPHDRRERPRP